MSADVLRLGNDLYLNLAGSSATGCSYTVTRAQGLTSHPQAVMTVTELAGLDGARLEEAKDGPRVIRLDGEFHAPSRDALFDELSRFKYLTSRQRGEQWFYWTPSGGAQRKILAVVQNDGGLLADVSEDNLTFTFTLELFCADPYWYSVSSTSDTEQITTSGNGVDVVNDGDSWTEPVIALTPKTAKTGTYQYRSFLRVAWSLDEAYIRYPFCITVNTAALVTAGKMQADGDDLRIWNNGAEVDRWIASGTMNTTATKVWVNLDFKAQATCVLNQNIGSGDTPTEIDITGDISAFPSDGILLINSELFTYTGRTASSFTGVTRAYGETTAGTHSGGATIAWIQHDLWLVYGNSTATAPSPNDDYKPIFDTATSTNSSWVYADFGNNAGTRTGAAWSYTSGTNVAWAYMQRYTGTHDTVADPWGVVGMHGYGAGTEVYGRWSFYNPCGITAYTMSGDYKISSVSMSGWIYFRTESSVNGSSIVVDGNISYVRDDIWHSWSTTVSPLSDKRYISLFADFFCTGGYSLDLYAEIASATITLNSSNVPTVTIGTEQAMYSMDAVLSDGTVSITIQTQMELNQTLTIDCGARTVTLSDGTNQLQALSWSSLREYWLRCPGHWNGGDTTTVTYTETGLVRVDMTVTWYDRWL